MADHMLKNRYTSSVAVSIFIALLMCSPALATTYYVSGTGSDQNSGLTQSTAFLTLQTAANVTQPGDTVFVMNGTYAVNPALWHQAVLLIAKAGTSAAPIKYAAYPGQHPIITGANNPKLWDVVEITASYISFSGFEVVGNAQYVTLAQATATASQEEQQYLQSRAASPAVPIAYPSDSSTNGNCVDIENSVHVTIEQNVVHDCSASGIDAGKSDYTSIENNVVFNTSWWTVYDTSGINLFGTMNSDNYTGYKNYILNNISFGNGNTQAYYNPAIGGGVPTDGNGIIVDVNQSTNNGKPYVGRTLVMGNIVYDNGGSGAHAMLSSHVDMFNNTAFMNNTCPVQGSTCGNISEGQIFANQSSDVNIYNNIMYGPTGKFIYISWGNTAVSEDRNIFYSPGGQITLKSYIVLNKGDVVADPKFNNSSYAKLSPAAPSMDAYYIGNPRAAISLLGVMTTSPARRAGTSVMDSGTHFSPMTMDGNQGSGICIGALSAAGL